MDDHDLLVRIDERVESLRVEIESITNALDNHYVTQEEFRPIKTLVYGAVGFMLSTVTVVLLKYFMSG